MSENGFLVLESGETFSGRWRGGVPRAGEVVFNTSHSGYEEMATDPSYYSQILVLSAPMMGNYGAQLRDWESRRLWIEGFVCVEMYEGSEESAEKVSWASRLREHGVPILTDVDTRTLVLRLRDRGTTWGAVLQASNADEAVKLSREMIHKSQLKDPDWVWSVSRKSPEDIPGDLEQGPRIAVLDFGCKENTLRELKRRSSQIRVFPSRASVAEIKAWEPDGILLSNGPGDPQRVVSAVEVVKELLGWRPIMGICMGHQILGLAMGGQTFKLRFGHRGSNHPIRDTLLNRVYMTSQNHGYAVQAESLPPGTIVTHTNLNDQTVAGLFSESKRCLGVQFHPESRPGPHESVELFDYFMKMVQ